MKIAKTVATIILSFLATAVLCAGLLFAVCHIPQSAIEENSQQSAEYFQKHELFPTIGGDRLNMRADNYADVILFNVIYNTDTENVLDSMIRDSYYSPIDQEVNQSYHDTVFDKKAPDTEYSRYWHGSQLFIRPLLTVTDISGIRIVLGGLFVALSILLCILLIWKKQYRAAVVYVLAALLVQCWMIFFSLEYVFSFLVMAGVCLAAFCLGRKGYDSRWEWKITVLCAASGAVTCFFDFLTAETITYTVPMVLMLLIRKKEERLEPMAVEVKRLFKWGVSWLFSYGAMFAAKWLLVLATMGKAAFVDALSNAAYRIEGVVTIDGQGLGNVAGPMQRIIGLLLRNLACLFPVGSGISMAAILGLVAGVLFLLLAVFYLFRKEQFDGRFVVLLLLIGLIPYLRFLCLSNHAYIHYFFTYRAQMATIMALAGILAFSLDGSYGAKLLPAGKKKNSTKTSKKRRRKK